MARIRAPHDLWIRVYPVGTRSGWEAEVESRNGRFIASTETYGTDGAAVAAAIDIAKSVVQDKS